jgi:predicted nucleic acid-binding protein
MSAKRFCLDSNVLVYAFDFRDPAKQAVAEQLVRDAALCDCTVGLQSIGEFYTACIKPKNKLLSPANAAREAMLLLALFPTFPATANAHRIAAREAAAGRLSYWDAVLLASAAEAGCVLLLSEDMADGARLGPITVRNPFGPGGLSPAATAALAP